ncbi:TRAP transporter small permease [Marinovum sp.]|uniref:TRAP transporter small permease n=1 Tax=Marinovum sp. TaxID=2024839 RepID=UPI002B275C90|nr:TRAP transporter small permease [Marinovum sp.]
MQRLLSGVRLVERISVVALLLTMTVLFAFNVLIRQFGGPLAASFGWIDEVVRSLNIFLVFLASGLALESGKQVAVDTWRNRIARRSGLPLRRILDAAGIIFCLYMAWISGRMAAFVFGTGQVSATLGISTGWLYVAPCAGFGLLALRYVASFVGAIERFDRNGETGE